MSFRSLDSVPVLIAVAEAQSLTKAAARLGVSPSAVSKSISKLEKELGARLVTRSTRRVTLTDGGSRLYERFRRIAAEIDQIDSDLATTLTTFKGRLKIQLPIAFGRRVIVPYLGRFIDNYPNLSLDIELSDRITDLHSEHIDLAVQIGEVSDAALVARRICTLRYVACASPSYLARHPEPAVPADLANHRCLCYFNPQTGRYRDWHFHMGDRDVVYTPKGYVNFNNTESLLDSAISGLGVIMVSTFVAAHAVRAGKLTVLLKPFMAPGRDVFAVTMPHMASTARVKAFVSFLQSVVPLDPLWDHIVE